MRVAPIRFTDDLPAMRRFCEALGLHPDVVADNGGWVALSADAGGVVALHPAATADDPRTAGETALSFETAEPLEAVQSRLAASGYEAHIVDEAFGRSLRVVDPDGVLVQVNSVLSDTYGYTVSDRAGS